MTERIRKLGPNPLKRQDQSTYRPEESDADEDTSYRGRRPKNE
jgi:hypothetical protein